MANEFEKTIVDCLFDISVRYHFRRYNKVSLFEHNLVRKLQFSGTLLQTFCSKLCRVSHEESIPRPAPEKGKNVCAFERTRPQLVLRRNATTEKKVKVVDCGIFSFPKLQCKEER